MSGSVGKKEDSAVLDLHLTRGILPHVHHSTELCSISPYPSSCTDTIPILHHTYSSDTPGADLGFVQSLLEEKSTKLGTGS